MRPRTPSPPNPQQARERLFFNHPALADNPATAPDLLRRARAERHVAFG